MTLLDLLTALRERRRVALAVFVVIMAATAGVTLLQQPTYLASSRVLIAPESSNNADAMNRRLQYLQGSLGTYSELVSSEVVASRVVAKMGDGAPNEDQIKHQISGHYEEGINLIQIEARSGTPEQATDLANATADVFGQVVELTEQSGQDVATPVRVTVVDRARVPGSPVSPRWPVNLLVGGVLAAVLATCAAVLTHFQRMSRHRNHVR